MINTHNTSTIRASIGVRAIADSVLIVDRDGDVSVTNDAEAVVAMCLSRYGNRLIYYRDTDGRWDQLKHDGVKFTGYAPLDADLAEWCKDRAP